MAKLTFTQVVQRYAGRYSRSTLHRFLLSGKLKGSRLAGPSGRWLIDEAELEKLEPRPYEAHQ